jgi:uncharacterized protein
MNALLAPRGPVVQKIRTAFPSAFAIYAFGSQVLGTAGPQSDLDLAVLVPGYAPPAQLWDLGGALADLAHCPVDLVDLRAASTVMQHQVITTGRKLWSTGSQAGLYECFILSEKTNLDEARAGLLADIGASGHIYAR